MACICMLQLHAGLAILQNSCAQLRVLPLARRDYSVELVLFWTCIIVAIFR